MDPLQRLSEFNKQNITTKKTKQKKKTKKKQKKKQKKREGQKIMGKKKSYCRNHFTP